MLNSFFIDKSKKKMLKKIISLTQKIPIVLFLFHFEEMMIQAQDGQNSRFDLSETVTFSSLHFFAVSQQSDKTKKLLVI